MPETEQTEQVWTGLSDELGKKFELIALRVGKTDASSTIARGIQHYRPSGIVLMNNPTVAAYRSYQKAARASRFPPAVIVMSSFLEGHRDRPLASTGISYEVPLITVVTNLRKLIASRIERVGVVQREALSRFVSRQAELAEVEQTRVIRETVGREPNTSEIKRALRKLKQQVDAIWVLNDDRLLTPQLIMEGWLPGLNERPWVPTIVGAASLVAPGHSFGTFAVLPDHTALGVQAANLMFDIADNHWTVPDANDTQLPVSTTTTVDLTQVLERFTLRDGALAQVDRIVER
jgi:putative ABC transport system substrate-binding protein